LDLPDLRSILVVRLDQIGDLVLTSSFLRELRRNAPKAFIALVVKPATRGLVESCPYVDEVLTFDWSGSIKLRLHARALALAAKSLWHRHFDLAILPRWGTDSYHAAFVAYFSGALHRVGYSETVDPGKRIVNSGYDCLLTSASYDSQLKHEVERNLDLLSFLGGTVLDSRLEAWYPESDRAYCGAILTARGVRDQELLVAIAPGASKPRKRWPYKNFVEVGRFITDKLGGRVVVVGGQSEAAMGAQIGEELGRSTINLAGRTTLSQTAAVLECCRLTVSNCSGPMHLAAAVGSSVVEISCHPLDGSANSAYSPARFHPWGVPHMVVRPDRMREPCVGWCSAPEAHCVLGVEVNPVKEAVQRLTSSIPNSCRGPT
jgi:ADP-heptose:LPS heptosyltransferase